MRSLGELIKVKQKRKHVKKINEKVDEKCIEKIFLEVASGIIGTIDQRDFRRIAIKDGVLYVRTTSSSITSELWRNKEKIIKNLNKETGDETIKIIKTN